MLNPQQVQPTLQQRVMVPHPLHGQMRMPMEGWTEADRLRYFNEATKNRTKGMVKRVITPEDRRDFPIRPMFVKFRIVDTNAFSVTEWGSQHLVLDVNHLSEQACEWINSGQIVMDAWDESLLEKNRRAVSELQFTHPRREEEESRSSDQDDLLKQVGVATEALSRGGYDVTWRISRSLDSNNEEEIEVGFVLKRRVVKSAGEIPPERQQVYQQHLTNSRTPISLGSR